MAMRRRVSNGIEMKNLKLGQRLIGLFMFMAMMVVITGGFGAWSMKRVADRIQGVLNNLANQQKQVLLMEVAQKDCHVNLLNAAMVRTEVEKFEEYSDDYQAKRELFRSKCEIILKGNDKMEIKPAPSGSVIESKAKAALASWAEFEKVAEALLSVKGKLLKEIKPGANGQAALSAMTDNQLHQES